MAPVSSEISGFFQPSFESILRRLAARLPNCQAVDDAPALELSPPLSNPARLISAQIAEGNVLRAHPVSGSRTVGFAAFLDGTQTSRVLAYLPGGVPIVHGMVAAVIRDRREGRMHTWKHVVERRLYLSRAHVSDAGWGIVTDAGLEVMDTSDGSDAGDAHPFVLRESARHRVQKDRERAEHLLGVDWCQHAQRPLFVDGSISGIEPIARAPGAVGVIKSHRTLYATGEALVTVLGLNHAERSSVFLVTSPKRGTVASWYLRIRDPRGHDPMWGLVRVEVAARDAAERDLAERDLAERELAARANEVSQWILAESAPVALPDARWDRMAYGVRDCEEFLRAVT